MLISFHVNKKSREACIKASSTSTWLASIGRVTRHNTVKWCLACKQKYCFLLGKWALYLCKYFRLLLWNINMASMKTPYTTRCNTMPRVQCKVTKCIVTQQYSAINAAWVCGITFSSHSLYCLIFEILHGTSKTIQGLFWASKFSAPTIAFLAFWSAKKLRLWANGRSFTSYGK